MLQWNPLVKVAVWPPGVAETGTKPSQAPHVSIISAAFGKGTDYFQKHSLGGGTIDRATVAKQGGEQTIVSQISQPPSERH